MNFIKKIIQNRKIKKAGLTEIEYILLHKFDKTRPTKSTIKQELYNHKVAKYLFSITVKEYSDQIIEELISLGIYRSYKSRYSLTTKGEKLLTLIGTPIKSKLYDRTQAPNTSAAITISIWFFISIFQIITGLMAKSYGLFALGFLILLKVSFPILSWMADNKKTATNITKIISTSFIIAALPLVIIGISQIISISFVGRSLVTLVAALSSSIALGALYIFQNQVIKKNIMFSLSFLNNKTYKFFIFSLVVGVIALASYAGIPLLDPAIMLLIGASFLNNGIMILKDIKKKTNTQKDILTNWFQYLSKGARKRFFDHWLRKIIKEKPVLKSEIISIYKKNFGSNKTSLFLNMPINIAHDDFFQIQLDRYLAHLLYAEVIIIENDKFQIK